MTAFIVGEIWFAEWKLVKYKFINAFIFLLSLIVHGFCYIFRMRKHFISVCVWLYMNLCVPLSMYVCVYNCIWKWPGEREREKRMNEQSDVWVDRLIWLTEKQTDRYTKKEKDRNEQ